MNNSTLLLLMFTALASAAAEPIETATVSTFHTSIYFNQLDIPISRSVPSVQHFPLLTILEPDPVLSPVDLKTLASILASRNRIVVQLHYHRIQPKRLFRDHLDSRHRIAVELVPFIESIYFTRNRHTSIFGFGSGSLTAFQFAAATPHVRRLVLIDPILEFSTFLEQRERNGESVRKQFRSFLRQANQKQNTKTTSRQWEPITTIPNLQCKIVILHAAENAITTPQQVDAWVRKAHGLNSGLEITAIEIPGKSVSTKDILAWLRSATGSDGF